MIVHRGYEIHINDRPSADETDIDIFLCDAFPPQFVESIPIRRDIDDRRYDEIVLDLMELTRKIDRAIDRFESG